MNADEIYYHTFLDGDNSGFEALVLKYKDNLIYFLYRYVNDLHQAEDLAQDAFVDIYINPKKFWFQCSFKTYLFTIARNKAIDYIRKQKRIVLTEQGMLNNIKETTEQEETTLLEKILKEEEKKVIAQAIKQLKPDYATAILLIDFEELSQKEVAAILHKTVPQVKVLIHRARKSLGKILQKGGYCQ